MAPTEEIAATTVEPTTELKPVPMDIDEVNVAADGDEGVDDLIEKKKEAVADAESKDVAKVDVPETDIVQEEKGTVKEEAKEEDKDEVKEEGTEDKATLNGEQKEVLPTDEKNEVEQADEAVAESDILLEKTPKGKRTRSKREVVVSPPVSTRPQRQRKSADRYATEDVREKPEFEIKEGKGLALKDIASIAGNITRKARNDEIMALLHSVLYGKRAKVTQVKKNILEFSGFVFESNEEKELAKVRDKLTRFTKEGMHQLLRMFNLTTSGKKDEQVDLLLDFLVKPREIAVEVKSPKSSREKKKKVYDNEEEEEEEEEFEVEPPAKKPRTPTSGKRKPPATEVNLKKRVKELGESGQLKKLSVDDVIKKLSVHLAGDLDKKKAIIEKFINQTLSSIEGSEAHPEEAQGETAENEEEKEEEKEVEGKPEDEKEEIPVVDDPKPEEKTAEVEKKDENEPVEVEEETAPMAVDEEPAVEEA